MDNALPAMASMKQSLDMGAGLQRDMPGPRTAGVSLDGRMPLPRPVVSPERRGLKEPIIGANGGGIGVSYSNVVLAGGLNPREQGAPVSNYKGSFDQRHRDPPGYTKGLDFNARVKYDYNIVSNQGPGLTAFSPTRG